MSDFLNWEDLDLDDLLGEYTDGDMCEFDSSDSSCEYDVESVNRSYQTGAADVAEKKMKCTVSYSCPSCPKTYRSISGFRGHVMKVRNLLGLKGMIIVL